MQRVIYMIETCLSLFVWNRIITAEMFVRGYMETPFKETQMKILYSLSQNF